MPNLTKHEAAALAALAKRPNGTMLVGQLPWGSGPATVQKLVEAGLVRPIEAAQITSKGLSALAKHKAQKGA